MRKRAQSEKTEQKPKAIRYGIRVARRTDADGAETIEGEPGSREAGPEARLALQTGTIRRTTTTTTTTAAAAATALACDANGMLALTTRRARQSLLPTPKRPREYLDNHLDEGVLFYAPGNTPHRSREYSTSGLAL